MVSRRYSLAHEPEKSTPAETVGRNLSVASAASVEIETNITRDCKLVEPNCDVWDPVCIRFELDVPKIRTLVKAFEGDTDGDGAGIVVAQF